MDYRLQDLVDPAALTRLLDNIHKVVPLSVSIKDLEGKTIAKTAGQDICLKMLKADGVSGALCKSSDARALERVAGGDGTIIYACPHGLVDCASPITIAGKHVASLLAGQIFLQPPDEAFFRSHARQYGFDEEEFIEALRRVPVIPRDELERHLKVLGLFTGMLGELGIEGMREIEAREALADGNDRLRRAYEYSRNIIETGIDAVAVIAPDGRIADVNAAAERITGLSREKLIGRPGDIFSFQEIAKQVYAEGGSSGVTDFEAAVQRRDGTIVPVQLNAAAYTDADGRTGGLLISAHDLTRRRRNEEQISRAEQYRLLADNSTDIIARTDRSGAFLYVSPSVEKIAGYRPEELLGRPLGEFVHPNDREQIEKMAAWFAQQREPMSVCYRSRCKDGSYIWLETAARPMFGADGEITEVQSSSRNVTLRKHAEEELQKTKEQLHVMLRNIDAAVFQLDANGTFTTAEGRGLSKLNRTHRAVTGRSAADVHEGDEAVARAVKQALSGRRAAAEHAAGGVILEETFTPYFDADGRQAGVIGLAVDVTQRKLSEQKLYAEKERLRVTLQSIGDGVIATDGEGRIALMNGVAEELTGWKAREAEGMPFAKVFNLYDEATGEACPNPVERVLSTGNIVGLGNHTALRSASGTVRSIADSAAPILDENKNILGAILVFRDVTEAKKKESEITYLSYHDMLTGLYNRTFLEEETHRLDTGRQLPISVVMGDVNGLKLTNDVFGHAEGDNLLVRIANILRECCRDEDIVARVGGDEFCILLPKTAYAAAADICRRIYARCEKVEYGLPSGSAKLSISLGFATKAESGESIHGVTKAAEDSMYRRKLLESRSQHSFLISSIRTTLFEKSYETEQHAQRLIANSKAIAAALNLPEDQLNDVELFALLHDIGKIAIDSRILTKAGPLDEDEWAEMKRHPEIGFRIAQASPDLAHIAEYILCHHERWDGTGYPQGLKGTAIPLLARILNVVDAYDAMTQDRVYRKAMTKEQACAELMKNAGTQFDPNIVWVFMEILEHEYYIA